jgi:hypothetical protein
MSQIQIPAAPLVAVPTLPDRALAGSVTSIANVSAWTRSRGVFDSWIESANSRRRRHGAARKRRSSR